MAKDPLSMLFWRRKLSTKDQPNVTIDHVQINRPKRKAKITSKNIKRKVVRTTHTSRNLSSKLEFGRCINVRLGSSWLNPLVVGLHPFHGEIVVSGMGWFEVVSSDGEALITIGGDRTPPMALWLEELNYVKWHWENSSGTSRSSWRFAKSSVINLHLPS